MKAGKISIVYYLLMSVVLISQLACVSRYTPLKKIRPLSGSCEDYIRFSDSLTKQREQGLSKRATINIAGFSVGSEENKKLLYELYKPIIEIIYANFLVSVDSVKVFAGVQCEHQLDKSWVLLATGQYRAVAKIIRFCRKDNHSDEFMALCILDAAKGRSENNRLNRSVDNE